MCIISLNKTQLFFMVPKIKEVRAFVAFTPFNLLMLNIELILRHSLLSLLLGGGLCFDIPLPAEQSVFWKVHYR